ncbi:MAG: hypothetical protein M0036_07565 [Desulfobacteraceae bacterium]|nr:hypothetical protein [Desulfobacteraceae bacterium]
MRHGLLSESSYLLALAQMAASRNEVKQAIELLHRAAAIDSSNPDLQRALAEMKLLMTPSAPRVQS